MGWHREYSFGIEQGLIAAALPFALAKASTWNRPIPVGYFALDFHPELSNRFRLRTVSSNEEEGETTILQSVPPAAAGAGEGPLAAEKTDQHQQHQELREQQITDVAERRIIVNLEEGAEVTRRIMLPCSYL